MRARRWDVDARKDARAIHAVLDSLAPATGRVPPHPSPQEMDTSIDGSHPAFRMASAACHVPTNCLAPCSIPRRISEAICMDRCAVSRPFRTSAIFQFVLQETQKIHRHLERGDLHTSTGGWRRTQQTKRVAAGSASDGRTAPGRP